MSHNLTEKQKLTAISMIQNFDCYDVTDVAEKMSRRGMFLSARRLKLFLNELRNAHLVEIKFRLYKTVEGTPEEILSKLKKGSDA